VTKYEFILFVAFGLASLCLIGAVAFAGCRQMYGSLVWRRVKFYSSLLGVVGFFVLLVNMERTFHDILTEPLKASIEQLFDGIKTYTATFAKVVCLEQNNNEQTKLNCIIARDIDIEVGERGMTKWTFLKPIDPPFDEANKLVSERTKLVLRKVNESFAVIKSELPKANRPSIFSDKARVTILLFGALFVVFALVGSIGEAAYQLAREKRINKETGTQ
jgi:hypothetical protein